jgi:hypothetical protein
MFNAFLLNTMSSAILMIGVVSVPTYTFGTEVFKFCALMIYDDLNVIFLGVSVFTWVFCLFLILTGVGLLLKGAGRVDFTKLALKQKKKDAGEDDDKIRPLRQ